MTEKIEPMFKSKAFKINNRSISPGQQELINLNVARLPSGTVINIGVHVFRSKNPGPTVLMLGGVHGDEINGVEIVRRAIEQGIFHHLERGSIIAIPLLNVYGFINFSRDASEGKDVNRSFPGSLKGSLASRVAANINKNILPLIDFGVDFHTGGGSRYNYPQIRFSPGDTEAQQLAQQFGTPYHISKSPVAKTLRRQAAGLGKPILTFEGGESLRYDGYSIEKGLQGIRRLLYLQQMTNTPYPPASRMLLFHKTSWVRAAQSGLFVWTQQSGAKVQEGELLGVINDPYGHDEIPVLASRSGYLIGHNNAPVVNAGDALFHIGYKMETIE